MLAKQSVEILSAKEPEWTLTGHGKIMRGEVLKSSLKELAANFDRTEIPANGKYVH